MESDDLEPKKKIIENRDLTPLSLEELRDYISALKAEIIRVESTITAKTGHQAAAAAFFKKGIS